MAGELARQGKSAGSGTGGAGRLIANGHGPLNLINKDVFIAAEGAHALNAILEYMKGRSSIHIAAGLLEGMEVEIWPDEDDRWKEQWAAGVAKLNLKPATGTDSDARRQDFANQSFGRTTRSIPRPAEFHPAGFVGVNPTPAYQMAVAHNEEVKVKITKLQEFKIPYYVYVEEWSKADATQKFMMEHMMQVVEFGISTGVAGATQAARAQWLQLYGQQASGFGNLTKAEFGDMVMGVAEFLGSALETGETLHDLLKDHSHDCGIWQAATSKRMKVLITCHKLCNKTPVAEHTHEHSLPTLAKEIASKFWAGCWKGAAS
jgi:hypothetical protein